MTRADAQVPVQAIEVENLCRLALRRAGASERLADTLAGATCQAEVRGNSAVGVMHLFDYLSALRSGGIDGEAEPVVRCLSTSIVVVDADSGAAQLAFADAFDVLLDAVRGTGVGILSIHSSFTVGELGYYVRRLAEAGMFAIAGANGPALMAFAGSVAPVLGTNPLAFAAPRVTGPMIVVDQASSQTAFVNIRRAAEQGESIPPGWAIDRDGRPTVDPLVALSGALLPFGGYKGGNIAFLVELLATLSGAQWSVSAPPFDRGDKNPGIGLFVLAVDPDLFDNPLPQRLDEYFEHLSVNLGLDMSVWEDSPDASGTFLLDADLLARLREASGPSKADRSDA